MGTVAVASRRRKEK
ncbi:MULTISPECIES: hypothetical protein [Streptococcus]